MSWNDRGRLRAAINKTLMEAIALENTTNEYRKGAAYGETEESWKAKENFVTKVFEVRATLQRLMIDLEKIP
jgi:hypothetical protein